MKAIFSKALLTVVASVSLVFGGQALACDAEVMNCYDSFQSVGVGGDAWHGGYAAGMFEGGEGAVTVDKTGYAFTETTLTAAGDACGLDCQDISVSFTGAAGEFVNSAVWASGSTSGEAVSAINEGAASSMVNFSIWKQNIETPAQ